MNPNHPRHHAHVFSLTEDIEKTHYSYDLITGPGSQSTHRDLKCSRTLPPCRRCGAGLDEDTRGLSAAKGESLTMKSYRVTLLIVLLVLAFCAAAWAQDTGSITGTVTDSSGAAVVNAAVVVANPDHGIDRHTVTNSAGEYNASALPGGTYNVLVSATGFKKYQAKGVVLDVAQKARVDVTLQVGAATT